MVVVKSRRSDRDMTSGGIFKNILMFSLPLLAGNLFQQLYNMVDTWVIGQTGNTGAYAAVGSIGPITNMLIGFFLGLSSGAGVVISQLYGAKKEEDVHTAVHTSVAMTLILGVIFTVVGILMTPIMLNLMLREEEGADVIYPHAETYLTVYFAGVMGLMIYNMGSGILRAVGDSRHPFYFLIASAVTNTVLDLVFVFWLDWGAFGVAFATVIAEAFSAVLTVRELLKNESCVRVTVKEIKLCFPMLRKIVRVGIPAAVQMAITAFSNVFVQSYISGVNGVKADILSGWTTYSKVDQFIFLPVQSVALAATTFVGQNIGKGNVERAKKGVIVSYLMSTGASVIIMIPTMFFAPYIASVFNASPAVVEHATTLLHIITPFYLFCSVNQIFAAALRGAGNTRAPMIIMLSAFVGIRQIYLFLVSNYVSNDLILIALSYPCGWMCCSVGMLITYLCFDFTKARLITDKKQ